MNKYLIGITIAFAFFLFQLFTLSDYGINWDGPDHMMRGQAITQFYLTGSKVFDIPDKTSPIFIKPNEYASRFYFTPSEMGTKAVLPKSLHLKQDFENLQNNASNHFSFYQDNNWNGNIYVDQDGPGHLPLVDIFSAISNRIFYQQLNVMGDIQSYLLIYILLSSIGVFVVYIFTFDISNSILASLIASTALSFFPVFFAESHFNMKDPIQASFFAGAVWAFWHFVKDNKKRWFMFFTAFIAFALGVKWNIVFIPFVLIPWLFFIHKTLEFRRWFKFRKVLIYILLFLVSCFLFILAIWPYSWPDPIGRLLEVANFYIDFGQRFAPFEPTGFILPLGINIYPLLLLLTQTPEIILILVCIGVFSLFKKYRNENLRIGYLLFFWLLIPILRLLVPKAGFYGGIRQFMEILPAMAIIAGLGAKYLALILIDLFYNKLAWWKNIRLVAERNNIMLSAFLFVSCVLLLINVIRFHPNENTYFNILTGGTKGAWQNNLVDWSITFGNVYEQGVNWLNSHAQKNASLAHLDGSNFAISPLWLRDDISFSPDNFSGFDQKGEYFMALNNSLDPPSFAARYPKRFLRPVYTVYADRYPLLFIYQNSPNYSKIALKNQQLVSAIINPVRGGKQGDYLSIDLGKDLIVTQLLVKAPAKCLAAEDDTIELVPAEEAMNTQSPQTTFYVQEKKDLGNGEVAFYFSAETSRYIYILPQSKDSCFIQSKLALVSFLP